MPAKKVSINLVLSTNLVKEIYIGVCLSKFLQKPLLSQLKQKIVCKNIVLKSNKNYTRRKFCTEIETPFAIPRINNF